MSDKPNEPGDPGAAGGAHANRPRLLDQVHEAIRRGSRPRRGARGLRGPRQAVALDTRAGVTRRAGNFAVKRLPLPGVHGIPRPGT